MLNTVDSYAVIYFSSIFCASALYIRKKRANFFRTYKKISIFIILLLKTAIFPESELLFPLDQWQQIHLSTPNQVETVFYSTYYFVM